MTEGGATTQKLAGGGVRELLVPLSIAALVGWIAFRHGPRDYDDAYITFRYARNLVEGHGFVYNPGERVLGTSAPLWGLLLSVVSRLGGSSDFPRLAFLLSALCLPAIVLLGWLLVRRAAPPLVAAAALAAALASSHTLAVFASGMETPLYMLAILAAAWLFATGRDLAAFAVAGLLPFVHPEAALLFPCLAAGARVRDGRWPVRVAALGALPALLFAAALTIYFGSPLPQSILAKAVVYERTPVWALASMSESFVQAVVPAPRPGGMPSVPGFEAALEALPLAVVSALLVVTFVKMRRAGLAPEFVVLLLFSAALYLVFGLANRPFEWYDPPFVLPAVLTLGAAAGAAGARLGALWSVLLLAAAALHMATFEPYRTEMSEEPYRRAVEALHLGQEDVVAASEIGAIGYHTKARVLDAAGLVSPEAIAFERTRRSAGLPASDGAFTAGFFERFRPAYVVALDVFLDPALREDPHALGAYEEIGFTPASKFGSKGVHVYRRRAGKGEAP